MTASCFGGILSDGFRKQRSLQVSTILGDYSCLITYHTTGTDAAQYNVRLPMGTESRPRVGLQTSGVTFGKYVTASVTLGRGWYVKPVNDDFFKNNVYLEVDRLRHLPVVMYDTDGRRAWLVDGASALLHITRAQLCNKRFLEACGLEQAPGLTAPAQYGGGDDALKILTHHQNLELDLMKRWHATRHESDDVIEKSDKSIEKERSKDVLTFRDLIRGNLQYLEKIRECLYEDPSGLIPDIRATLRPRLDGFPFRCIVDRSPGDPGILYLEQGAEGAEGWTQYARQIKAIVLLGHGFGEIIRPSSLLEVAPCCDWSSVPAGQDLFAASLKTLREIAEGYPTEFPNQLTSEIRWHQPNNLFEPFCLQSNTKRSRPKTRQSCQRIQEMFQGPLRTVGLVKHPTPNACFDVQHEMTSRLGPAVIFGRPKKVMPNFVHRMLDPLSNLIPFRRGGKMIKGDRSRISEHTSFSRFNANRTSSPVDAISTGTSQDRSGISTRSTAPISVSTSHLDSTAATSISANTTLEPLAVSHRHLADNHPRDCSKPT
jgi:hypothetical protein